MNVAHRRGHLIAWIALTALITVGFAGAYLVIPEYVTETGSMTGDQHLLKRLSAVETSWVSYTILQDPSSGAQFLEVFVKSPLPSSFSVLTITYGDEAVDLGLLRSVGRYQFPLSEDLQGDGRLDLSIVDKIRQVEIDHANLQRWQ